MHFQGHSYTVNVDTDLSTFLWVLGLSKLYVSAGKDSLTTGEELREIIDLNCLF